MRYQTPFSTGDADCKQLPECHSNLLYVWELTHTTDGLSQLGV